ncbi:MAG: ABC transporter substrate-binding protein [Acetobacteraceae bacterium]|nr:ABC transporter substrate-binding protein [Acetobacteraceae bacterium]
MSLPSTGRRLFVASGAAASASMLGLLPAFAQDFGQVAAGIQRLYAALPEVMKAGAGTPFMQRYSTLVQPVSGALDLPAILQVAVGPPWSTIPPAQQAALQTAFQKYSVATYVSQFDSYGGEQFQVLPGLRTLPTGQPVLHTEIVPKSGDAHAIDYVMRQTPGGWKATDVLLDGTISRVAVLRSDFRRLLARGGPAELTNFLEQKATALSGMTSPP